MSDNVIEIKELNKSFERKKHVVKSLNMTVPRGSVYALLGNNGVGKTTTIRMITGQLQQDSGHVTVFGMDPIKDGVAMKKKTAYVAENQRLYDWMTVNDLIKFTKGFFPEWNEELCKHLLETFELPPKGLIRDFSRGMYTKAALLSALCRDPELLILDDPTLGLDTSSRREFMRGVVDVIHEFDRTVVFSTHIIPEIEGLVDYVGIMVDGKLKLEEKLDDLKSEFTDFRFPKNETIAPLPGEVKRETISDELSVVVRTSKLELPDNVKPLSQTPMNLEDIFLAVV